jgi:hypothetical protein
MVAKGRLSLLYETRLDLCPFRFSSDLYSLVFSSRSNIYRHKGGISGSSMVQ